MLLLTIALFFLFSSPVSAQDTVSPTATPSAVPTSVVNPSSGIYINEFMPAPEDNQEWVEIYNDNDYAVTLENWKFDDLADGGGQPKELGTIVFGPKEIKTYDLGGGYLNNTDDWVRLLNQSSELKDSYHYSSISSTLSWSKVSGSWCLTTPSKGSVNSPCPSPTTTPITPTPTSTLTPVPTATKTPTPTPTITPTTRPTATPIPTIAIIPTEPPLTPVIEPTSSLLSLEPSPTISEDILGISDIIKISPTSSPSKSFNGIPSNLIAIIFIAIGGLLLLAPLVITRVRK